MKYDDDWKWQFRIIKSHDKYESIDGKLSIQECLFDEDNVMVAHTTDYIVDGINLDEIRDKLKNMLTSIVVLSALPTDLIIISASMRRFSSYVPGYTSISISVGFAVTE